MAKFTPMIGLMIAAFGLNSAASAQGLVRLFADSKQTYSTMAAADERPVRLVVALKARQSISATGNNVRQLMSAVAEAQSQTRDQLSWLTKQVTMRYEFVPAVSLTANRSQIEELLRSDRVAAVYEDQPLFFHLEGSGPIIGKPGARALNATGSGQVVAVLDSGFDIGHPFLAGKIVSEACFSLSGTAAEPTENGWSNCPNGKPVEQGPGTSRYHAAPGFSGVGHGTHVAGIVAGKNDRFGGVASEAQLMLANVFYRVDRAKCPELKDRKEFAGCIRTYSSLVIAAVEWVFRQREAYEIAAINMSLGGGKATAPCDENNPMAQAFKLARSAEIAIVASSGNSYNKDGIGNPACASSAISVGATSDDDQVGDFSNSAEFLDILAPGVDISSSVPGGSYDNKTGTSMAAPHVAGAFAVLRSARPRATVEEMLKALVDTGVPVKDTNGIVKSRIQIDKAVAALQAAGETSKAKPKPKPKPKKKPRVVKKPPPPSDEVTTIGGIKVRKSPSGAVRKKSRNKAINPDGSIKW